MNTLAAATTHPSLDDSLGALTVGAILGIALYGAMCVQVFCYLQHNFKNDSTWVKFLVFWSILIETLHTVFVTMTLYTTVVTHFGDYVHLANVDWPLSFSVPVSSIISGPIQMFYAFRIYTLSRSLYIPLFCAIASLARLGMSFTNAILSIQIKGLHEFQTRYASTIISSLVIGTAVDVITTVSLCYLLVRSKENVVKSSRLMIDTLVLWTVETGLLTTIANIISFTLILAIPQQPTWLCPILFTAKLYSNSLLASLNGRVSLRATAASTNGTASTFTPSYIVSSESDEQETTSVKFNHPLHNRSMGISTGYTTEGTIDVRVEDGNHSEMELHSHPFSKLDREVSMA